jgi:octaprenyl-diphosphate synthase
VSIENIRSFIAQDMSAVDNVIRKKLHSHVALVRQVSEYIINSGGKRLRPALVVLSAGAFGYTGKHHHNLAAIV